MSQNFWAIVRNGQGRGKINFKSQQMGRQFLTCLGSGNLSLVQYITDSLALSISSGVAGFLTIPLYNPVTCGISICAGEKNVNSPLSGWALLGTRFILASVKVVTNTGRCIYETIIFIPQEKKLSAAAILLFSVAPFIMPLLYHLPSNSVGCYCVSEGSFDGQDLWKSQWTIGKKRENCYSIHYTLMVFLPWLMHLTNRLLIYQKFNTAILLNKGRNESEVREGSKHSYILYRNGGKSIGLFSFPPFQ